MRLGELFALIGKALAWHHWGIYLQAGQVSEAIFLSKFGSEFFKRVFAMNAAGRVQQDLGGGAVSYTGVQAVDTPQLTLWRIWFYGGMVLSGDPQAPNAASTEIVVMTGPKRIVKLLAEGADGA